MSRDRRSKGIRLWLQPERRDPATGKLLEHSVWVIRDGTRKRSTGCGATEIERAEIALADYIASRHRPEDQASADPRYVLISDVITLYSRDRVPEHARPKETAQRLQIVLDWWSDPERARRDLSCFGVSEAFEGVAADVRGATCRCFAKVIGKPSWARRLLEDLRAALNYAFDEGLIDRRIAVPLPDKPVARDTWLTRAEAARLIWAAWRYKEPEEGLANGRSARHTRRHLARFILMGLYTGTRKTAVLEAAFARTPGHGFIDLEKGVFYRRPAGRRETKKRQPPVPLPRRLLAHLRRWKRKGQAFPVEWNGAPVGEIDKAFRLLAIDAGLPHVTPHTLRHTAATWAMQNGGDPWKTAGYLGMSLQTLLDNYGHHHPDHLGGAGDMIADGRAGRIGNKMPPEAQKQSAS